jgi:hypothetical protein
MSSIRICHNCEAPHDQEGKLFCSFECNVMYNQILIEINETVDLIRVRSRENG